MRKKYQEVQLTRQKKHRQLDTKQAGDKHRKSDGWLISVEAIWQTTQRDAGLTHRKQTETQRQEVKQTLTHQHSDFTTNKIYFYSKTIITMQLKDKGVRICAFFVFFCVFVFLFLTSCSKILVFNTVAVILCTISHLSSIGLHLFPIHIIPIFIIP